MGSVAQVGTAALVWMLLIHSLRFMAVGAHALSPTAYAGWRIIWARGQKFTDRRDLFFREVDGLYIKLMAALTTPVSAALAYVGIFLMGLGLSIGSVGNVFRYMNSDPAYWAHLSQGASTTAVPLLVVGMSCLIAAVRSRRTASLIMSAGFVLAGVGIGIATTGLAS